MKPISQETLSLLRTINTPTLANAIELLNIRDRSAGFTRPSVHAVFPDHPAVVGFAVTIQVRSSTPRTPGVKIPLKPYWDHILAAPAPRIVIAQDLDQPAVGAWWGEINSNIHRALGCVGVVTDGTVRDIDEVRPLGFPLWAAGIAVSHVHAHLETFNTPVTVAGMSVHPGDLIHADRHGALVLPTDRIHDLLDAVTRIERYERPIIQLCKSPTFNTNALDQVTQSNSPL